MPLRVVPVVRCLLLAILLVGHAIAGDASNNGPKGTCSVPDMDGGPNSGPGDVQPGPEQQPGEAGKKFSDPVAISTGDYIRQDMDLFVPGVGQSFAFKRTYRSRSGYQSIYYGGSYEYFDEIYGIAENPSDTFDDAGILGLQPLGMNWDHAYNIRIANYYASNRTIQFYGGDGRRDLLQGSGTEFTRPEYFAKLEYTGDTDGDTTGSTMTFANNTVYTFAPLDPSSLATGQAPGRIHTIEDAHGNTLSFTYEKLTFTVNSVSHDLYRLASMTDTLSHTYTFTYHDATGSPHTAGSGPWDVMQLASLIWKVEDYAGRVVEYEYDFVDAGRDLLKAKLVTVKLPEIESTANFPLPAEHERYAGSDRRAWQYAYYAEPAGVTTSGVDATKYQDTRYGQLHTITSPNGNVIVENEYSDGVRDELFARTYFRVTRQVHGKRADGSDAAYNYAITSIDGQPLCDNPSDQGAVAIWDYVVWVNDREGRITAFVYTSDITNTDDFGRLAYRFEFPGIAADVDAPSSAGLPSTQSDLDDSCDGASLVAFWDYPELPVVGSTSEYVESWVNGPAAYVRADGNKHPFMKSYDFNDDWLPEEVVQPNGQKVTATYIGSLGSSGQLAAGAMTSRTRISEDGLSSITEEWEYEYDLFSIGGGCCGSNFATGYKDGRGYVTRYLFDTTPNGNSGRKAGDLLGVYRGLPSTSLSGSFSMSSALSVDEYTYRPDGQLLTHTLPATTLVGGTTHRRVDRFEYGAISGNNYLRITKQIRDYGGLALETTYEYDAIGNIIKVTDPSGHYRTYLYNQADQVVRTQAYEEAGTTDTLLAQTDYYYDANGNVIRNDVKNILPTGISDGQGTGIYSTLQEYDELDNIILTAQEIGTYADTPPATTRHFYDISSYTGIDGGGQQVTGTWVHTRITYDGNKLPIRVEYGEAVEGRQPNNATVMVYDERNLLYRQYRGTASISSPGTAALLVTEYEHDENGRGIATIVDPDGLSPQISEVAYDSLDRVDSRTDPMGNMTVYGDYDADLVQEVTHWGALDQDVVGSSENVILSRVQFVYDALGRRTITKTALFEPADPSPTISSSDYAFSTVEYNGDSSIKSRTIPAGANPLTQGAGTTSTVSYYYDGANRQVSTVDALGNESRNVYDVDGNITESWTIDVWLNDPGIDDEQRYGVAYTYDGLDRVVSMTHGATISGVYSGGPGNVATLDYDSRGNIRRFIDGRGFVTEYAIDGLGRTTLVKEGAGLVDVIATTTSYDDSGRVVSLTDDNGHTTTYEYDELGREIYRTMADGTIHSTLYDAVGNADYLIDARGIEVEIAYDANNRPVLKTVESGTVGGAQREEYVYDGAGRIRSAINYDSKGTTSGPAADSGLTKVTRRYDSRSNIIEEIQNADGGASGFPAASDRILTSVIDAANNEVTQNYPKIGSSGTPSRSISRTYDVLNRVVSIDEGTSNIAGYGYIGRGRVETRFHGNGTYATYTYLGYEGATPRSGDYSFGQVVAIKNVFDDGINPASVIDSREFDWDESGNKSRMEDVRSWANRPKKEYVYDFANRLVVSDVTFPETSSTIDAALTAYTLDGVHNRTSVTQTPSTAPNHSGALIDGTYLVDNYTMDSDTPVPADAQVNQYTSTPGNADADTGLVYAYDDNGNLRIRMEPCTADLTGDHQQDTDDLLAWLSLYSNNDPAADFDDDGDVDGDDYTAFNNARLADTTCYYAEYMYDYRNQLISVRQQLGADEDLVEADFVYDCFNRRVISEIGIDADDSGTIDGGEVDFSLHLYGGMSRLQLLAEQDSALSAAGVDAMYVYGSQYIDELVEVRRDNGTSFDEYFVHSDDLFTITALSDAAGVVVQRYGYGDYGLRAAFDSSGTPVTAGSLIAHGFTGRLHVEAVGLCEFRSRWHEPMTGSFLQRDPMGYWDAMNLKTMVASNPATYVDPLGGKKRRPSSKRPDIDIDIDVENPAVPSSPSNPLYIQPVGPVTIVPAPPSTAPLTPGEKCVGACISSAECGECCSKKYMGDYAACDKNNDPTDCWIWPHGNWVKCTNEKAKGLRDCLTAASGAYNACYRTCMDAFPPTTRMPAMTPVSPNSFRNPYRYIDRYPAIYWPTHIF